MKKILVIEDEKLVRENILDFLEAEGLEGIAAENGRIGLSLARSTMPDLILCDVMMPEVDGYSVLATLRQDSTLAAIPFIFLTAKVAKADFRQGMELGADDYLTKPFTRTELLGAINSRLKKQAVVQESYNTELQQAKKQLNYLMHHDSLTQLPNRLSLQEQFKNVKKANNSQEKLLSVLCLGLDRFNQINDELGHTFGDLLLKAISNRLTSCIGSQDVIARLNADQFAIILTNTNHKKDAIKIAETILENFSETFGIADQEIFITASIGIALFPRDGTNIELLLDRANKAMFQAKQQGGDQYHFYSAVLNIGSCDRISLKTSLRYALERQELEVHYQPQVSLQTGEIIGAEALLRWHHPERGFISPAKFIPLAEETGLIVPIGEWVLETGCQQIKHWQMSGFPSLRIAVNLSGRQFNQTNLRQRLVRILMATDIHPKYVELELTESLLIENTEVAIRRLNALKALGVEIAIDDFGTGYSSLSYLQQFSFDVLKIDQCFVRNIMKNNHSAAITQAIIQMAKIMNLKVIAEGVETTEELSFMCQNKCDLIQGYLFSRPLPAKEFEALLLSKKRLQLAKGMEANCLKS